MKFKIFQRGIEIKHLIGIFILAFTSMAHAQSTITVTAPAFTAEKIELNPVTNTFVVVNPKYFVNDLESVKIITSDSSGYHNETKVAKHLCAFLGMSGGKVITSTEINYSCRGKTLSIKDDGLYGVNTFSFTDCRVADFIECSSIK